MLERVFGISYLAGLVAASAVRGWYGRGRRRRAIADRCREGWAVRLLMGLWGVAQVAAVLHVVTSRLEFADYELPAWTGWVGVPVFAAGVGLLWKSHADLGRNWSPSLEVMEGHSLVTRGLYRFIRHPMYAAHWLWVVAQPLLLHNWIAGLGGLAVFLPLYLLRVPREERMMLNRFGDGYRSYVKQTGRLFPRMRKQAGDVST